MSEKLKELLEKINQEGVKQAEEKSRAIESEADSSAQRIIKEAKDKAQRIVEDAEKEAKKTKDITELALKQASRDLILSLKGEIRKIFDKVISAETAKSLSHENMVSILKSLIEKYIDKGGKVSDIKILLKKDDLERVKSISIAGLKEKLKDGIEFKPSPNITAGFSISFDRGKSFFDFTDEGLVKALAAYLNPELLKLFR